MMEEAIPDSHIIYEVIDDLQCLACGEIMVLVVRVLTTTLDSTNQTSYKC
jgi:hypothetical protein